MSDDVNHRKLSNALEWVLGEIDWTELSGEAAGGQYCTYCHKDGWPIAHGDDCPIGYLLQLHERLSKKVEDK